MSAKSSSSLSRGSNSVEDRELQKHSSDYPDRWLEAFWHLPDPVRRYRLVNGWCPWMIYPPYAVYESLLRRSPALRALWADPLKAATAPKRVIWKPCKTATTRLDNGYPYERLEANDFFRLLYLHPGRNDAPLKCSIAHCALSAVPDYRAISYAWGQQHTYVEIICDDRPLKVSATVHQLLHRLRKPDEAMVVWIDSVCINQAIVQERNHQVSLMGRIYSEATGVIVWLGEEDEETARVAHLLAKIQTWAGTRSHTPGDSSGMLPELPWRLDPCWTYLSHFLERSWFTRAWVLQEVMLAKQCEMRCGSYRWPGGVLHSVSASLGNGGPPDVTGVRQQLNAGVVGFSQAYSSHGSLLDLLEQARDTYSSDPRDKVYALLSLAHNCTLRADYSRKIEDVYCDVAIACLRDGNLDILRSAGDSVWNNIRHLPSWVPDWSSNERPVSLRQHRSGKLSGLHDTRFIRLSNDRRVLVVQARRIGSVRATGVPWSGNIRHQNIKGFPDYGLWEAGQFAYSRLESWRSMLWRWRDKSRRYIHTNESLTSAFARTVAADVDTEIFLDGDAEETYTLYRARLWELTRKSIEGFYSDRLQQADVLKEYHEAVRQACSKRTFFVTGNGYIGLGPFFTLPRDNLILVAGVTVPLIMRRTLTGKYRVVGECYVHGLMAGDWRWSRFPSEQISIV